MHIWPVPGGREHLPNPLRGSFRSYANSLHKLEGKPLVNQELGLLRFLDICLAEVRRFDGLPVQLFQFLQARSKLSVVGAGVREGESPTAAIPRGPPNCGLRKKWPTPFRKLWPVR